MKFPRGIQVGLSQRMNDMEHYLRDNLNYLLEQRVSYNIMMCIIMKIVTRKGYDANRKEIGRML